MSGRNVTEQKVLLNIKGFLENYRKLTNATKNSADEQAKATNKAGRAYEDYSNRVRNEAGKIGKSLSEMSSKFGDNVRKGALIGGTASLAQAVNSQMKQSIVTGMEFGRTFAHLASRADLSKDKIKSLRQEIKLLGKTGADLGSLPEAIGELYGATGSVDKAMTMMDPISKVAGITEDGDASRVAKFVRDQLKGQGRDLNNANATSLLTSLVHLQRNGDFKNIESAMDAYSGIDRKALAGAGLGDKDLSSLLAGSSRLGLGTEKTVSGINALINAAANGAIESKKLGSILGVGDLRTNGKLDINKLGSDGAFNQIMSLGSNDNERLEIFKKIAAEGGLSEESAEAVFDFIKNFKEMRKGIDQTLRDSKTLEQSVSESRDNLSDKLQNLRQGIVTGFDDIFGPLEEAGSQFLSGNFKSGLKQIPEAVRGIYNNKALVAGAIGATALTGILGKNLGLFGGGAKELAAGVAKGGALAQAGIQPVYVVNASEIRNNSAFGQDQLDRFGNTWGGKDGGGPKPAGKGSKALKVGGKILGAAAMVPLAFEGADAINSSLYGEGNSENKMIQNTLGNSAAEVHAVTMNAMASFFNMLGANFKMIQVEVQSKDPGLSVHPKANDLPREAR